MSLELLATARRLARTSRQKPRQSDLKRAVSTAYYALFHAMARNAADRLVGTGQDRSDEAWLQTYRALEHGAGRNACVQLRRFGFPAGIVLVGDAFISLQDARHKADYDPHYRINRADALALITVAEDGMTALRASTKRDRTTFAAQLLFKRR